MSTRYHKDRITALSLTPDNRYVISASDDTTIKVWDIEQQKVTRTLAGHGDRVTDLALTPDGNRILSGSWDQSIRIWDLRTGADLGAFSGQDGKINCLAIAPGGQQVVSISTGSGLSASLKIWDLESGLVQRSFPINEDILISVVALTPDGKRAVTASCLKRMVFVWELISGELIYALFNGNGSRKCSLDLSPDGHFALSGGDRGEITLWDIEKGTDIIQLNHFTINIQEPNFWQNPGLFICDVGFFNNGIGMMSCAADGTIKIWDVKSRTLMSSIDSGKPLTACTISSDGSNIIAGDKTGQVYFLKPGNN